MDDQGNIRFRYMQVEDIDNVLKIERSSFRLQWDGAAFYHEIIENRFATYIVAEENEKIIGYCGVWVILDESEVTNIALLPEYRGRKIGESLMRTCMRYAEMRGAKKMSLEVRVSNKIAQSMYRRLGFQEGGIRKNYYTNNREDALVMWVRL